MSLSVKPDALSVLADVLGPFDKGADASHERGDQIILAAYDLLEEAGLDGLTIRAVLTKTGLSRRAFYERFEGKDDLMLAVFKFTLERAASHYQVMVESVADPLERLRLIVTSIVLGKSEPGSENQPNNRRGAALSREHMRLAEARPDHLQAALSPLLHLIAQQLEDAMQAGSVRRDQPQRLASFIYTLVSTTAHTELLAQESAPNRPRQPKLADDIWEFCRRAITA